MTTQSKAKRIGISKFTFSSNQWYIDSSNKDIDGSFAWWLKDMKGLNPGGVHNKQLAEAYARHGEPVMTMVEEISDPDAVAGRLYSILMGRWNNSNRLNVKKPLKTKSSKA
jgi:hypothetical protein